MPFNCCTKPPRSRPPFVRDHTKETRHHCFAPPSSPFVITPARRLLQQRLLQPPPLHNPRRGSCARNRRFTPPRRRPLLSYFSKLLPRFSQRIRNVCYVPKDMDTWVAIYSLRFDTRGGM